MKRLVFAVAVLSGCAEPAQYRSVHDSGADKRKPLALILAFPTLGERGDG